MVETAALETAASSNAAGVTSGLFLICGQGALGQHCAAALSRFGVDTIAIDLQQPSNLEIANLSELLVDFVVGDCRQNRVLQSAQVTQCRAALIVTSNERVNAETALAVRALNPTARLIVRSSQTNLNRVLGDRLGNFVAFEPTRLAADAFVLAALGTETIGLLRLGNQTMRVVKRPIPAGDPLCQRRTLLELNSLTRRVLAHIRQGDRGKPGAFYSWEPDATLKPGDTLVYVETELHFAAEHIVPTPTRSLPHKQRQLRQMLAIAPWLQRRRQMLALVWQSPVRRLAFICGVMVVGLLVFGTSLLLYLHPDTTLSSALFATVVLLLGGYADLFGDVGPSEGPAEWWLRLLSLGLTLAGTVFVGVLYALLTETLLSSKFQLTPRRPPVPERDHAIIIGIRRVGKRVVSLLLDLKQPVVGIPLDPDFDPMLLPNMPAIAGPSDEALARANLKTAKSVIVGTEDELLNLELGLTIQKLNPACQLAIRTYGQRLSENLARLLPEARVLNAYAIVAEAFAGAAFGENILSLFQLDDRTVLVTEYTVESGDTLEGLLLAEVAYGYAVVPLLHARSGRTEKLMPSDDALLAVGDRMVVLATIDGLQRIELGQRNTSDRCWQVRIERAIGPEAVFEGGNTLVRVTGCSMALARDVMGTLPRTLNGRLYKHQAKRLIRELSRVRVRATAACVPKPARSQSQPEMRG
ncbi:K+ transport system, NAD-binding component [Rubidibacter lacunae KORDI 51-2]|uniref:K+ transport system, NAD-binding component n=1 Tax=Rubidibacter lacunae KORDI 51-2 TaxID=582515 RepID=U5DJV3_9CHRO|nr:NAD-binding protein [Rubidibacter lacunae]ERN40859.1 K+ transport system, NAD-binding component [Rubidibacter lacunae KORDI 51-2]